MHGAADSDLLFPDTFGRPCRPDAVASCWNLIVGEHVTDDLGQPSQRRLSKHSARRAGAQLLVRRGRPLAEVQYMGRWGSQTVERYVAEAAAHVATQSARPGGTGNTWYENQPALWELQSEVDQLKVAAKDVQELKQKVASQESEVIEPLRRYPGLLDQIIDDCIGRKGEPAVLPLYVLNICTCTIHRCDWIRSPFLAERSSWMTRCGFTYGGGVYEHTTDAPAVQQCKKVRCFGSRAVKPHDIVPPSTCPEVRSGTDSSDSSS